MTTEYVKDCRTREQKVEDFKREFKNKLYNGLEWADQHKELIIIFAPIVISGITTITKVAGKNINLRKAEDLKKLYIFDHSEGHYWHLRRELSNKEWLEIAKRKNAGEKLFDVLDDMRVLK